MQPTEAELLKHARAMRTNATPFEIIVWRHLSNSKLGSFKFRRQAVIGNAICDFFCPSRGLIVEIDGDTHMAGADTRRDNELAERGFQILRFSNREIAENLDGVLATILQNLHAAPDRWSSPHPNPSPEGEGLDR